MKLAHLADVHLGCRQYHRQTADGTNQREADVARVFERAVGDIVAAKPDLVVIAGDLFHSVRPTNPAILHAFDQIRRLRAELPKSPVIVVAGNHDTPRSTETGTILKLFEVLDGVYVVAHETRELAFEHLDLDVVCVPHAALVSGSGAFPLTHNGATRKVLVMHGEIAGVLNRDASALEYGGVIIQPDDLHAEEWDYVALGHYHVARSVAPNVWYSGSLDYVSTNPWGELKDEEAEGRRGVKGWLLVDVGEELRVTFRPVALERRTFDLEPIRGDGLGSGELDQLIDERVQAVSGGIRNEIVRQLVLDVPRPVLRDLDHKRIREIKSEALHYNLDVRRPTSDRQIGVGAPGRRQTLAELVEDYLTRRPLAADVDRKLLLTLSQQYMDEVERDLLEE
ncbi:exonuclease SbcCD subunit D [Gemmatimonadota bacterium]